jgi:hypothetical protein
MTPSAWDLLLEPPAWVAAMLAGPRPPAAHRLGCSRYRRPGRYTMAAPVVQHPTYESEAHWHLCSSYSLGEGCRFHGTMGGQSGGTKQGRARLTGQRRGPDLLGLCMFCTHAPQQRLTGRLRADSQHCCLPRLILGSMAASCTWPAPAHPRCQRAPALNRRDSCMSRHTSTGNEQAQACGRDCCA